MDVSGALTSCQHNKRTLVAAGAITMTTPTLLPWLEYFFTESARPWTKRRSTLSYSVETVERKFKRYVSEEAVICSQFAKVFLILSLFARSATAGDYTPAAITL